MRRKCTWTWMYIQWSFYDCMAYAAPFKYEYISNRNSPHFIFYWTLCSIEQVWIQIWSLIMSYAANFKTSKKTKIFDQKWFQKEIKGPPYPLRPLLPYIMSVCDGQTLRLQLHTVDILLYFAHRLLTISLCTKWTHTFIETLHLLSH